MANAKCRSCGHAADAGAYCSSWAADIMAKALNPFFGGGEKVPPAGCTWRGPSRTRRPGAVLYLVPAAVESLMATAPEYSHRPDLQLPLSVR